MRLNYRFRKRYGGLVTLLVLLVWLLFLGGAQELAGKTGQSGLPVQPGYYNIAHFTDGDTIAITMNGHVENIRLVGVDTPETHKPNTPVQCYGPAAAAYTKSLIGSQSVRLVSDPQSTDRDRYDRLLRYVYLPDGRLVNELLIQNGYGFYYPYFPFTKADQFAAAQAAAQTAHKGLWSACQPTATDRGGYLSNPQDGAAAP